MTIGNKFSFVQSQRNAENLRDILDGSRVESLSPTCTVAHTLRENQSPFASFFPLCSTRSSCFRSNPTLLTNTTNDCKTRSKHYLNLSIPSHPISTLSINRPLISLPLHLFLIHLLTSLLSLLPNSPPLLSVSSTLAVRHLISTHSPSSEATTVI